MQGAPPRPRKTDQPPLPGLTSQPEAPPPDRTSLDYWLSQLGPILAAASPDALPIAEDAIRACADPALLPIAALAALVADQPDRTLGFIRRVEKKYEPTPATALLTALAIARQGHSARAWALLLQHGLDNERQAARWFAGPPGMVGWLLMQLAEIRHALLRQQQAAQAAERQAARAAAKRAAQTQAAETRAATAARGKARQSSAAATPSAAIADLPRLEVALDVTFAFTDPEAVVTSGGTPDPVWFDLRHELVQLGLVEGFDELLCLPTLQGVEAHWYQIETVRKVLKQYRGRVLLADEVGLFSHIRVFGHHAQGRAPPPGRVWADLDTTMSCIPRRHGGGVDLQNICNDLIERGPIETCCSANFDQPSDHLEEIRGDPAVVFSHGVDRFPHGLQLGFIS
ncbi:protein of unknown function (plasmid) [Rhodovastum atsumiense]|nr:protein of unknown function [Rhodovastum atsumiense]